MIKIILCDDDQAELEELKVTVTKHLTEKKQSFSVSCFEASSTLDFELEDVGKADLYILDIDMPEPNGIQLAKKIRELHPNSIVYFYTSHREYATEGYRVEARRYLIKGEEETYLKEALDYACHELERLQEDCISVSVYHDTVNIPLADVMYIQKDGRKVVIHTHSQGKIETNENVQSLCKRIDRPYFIYINRSTVINIDFVRRTDQQSVILFGGEELEISRGRLVETKQAIGKYWRIR